MSLRTRLDVRVTGNNKFTLLDKDGEFLAEVKLIDVTSATLDIVTKEDLYITKPNGWSSKKT